MKVANEITVQGMRMNKKRFWEYLLWYSFFSFVIFATWEWIQTPFFIDVTNEINTIVWYRIHCTFGDMMILFFTILGTSLIHRKINWIFSPSKKYYLTVMIIGVTYTFFSEYRNVSIAKNWSYSELMPEVLGFGLIPLFQWVILPPLILYILKRFVDNEG